MGKNIVFIGTIKISAKTMQLVLNNLSIDRLRSINEILDKNKIKLDNDRIMSIAQQLENDGFIDEYLVGHTGFTARLNELGLDARKKGHYHRSLNKEIKAMPIFNKISIIIMMFMVILTLFNLWISFKSSEKASNSDLRLDKFERSLDSSSLQINKIESRLDSALSTEP